MPELPEVETVVRALRAPLVGRVFADVRNDWPRHIATPAPQELAARLPGREILAISRRGKYLVFTLSQHETLIIHLKMSGHLAVVDSRTPPDKHVHTIFGLVPEPGRETRQELRFRDPRKFGRVYLVHDPQDILGKLGPEPLDEQFTVAALRQRLAGRRRVLKPLLLDQSVIAGIGNIYADEALWRAQVHGRRMASTLTKPSIARVLGHARDVMTEALGEGGTSFDALYVNVNGASGYFDRSLAAYGQVGRPCRRCGTLIMREHFMNRSSFFCPRCQVAPRRPR